MLLPWYGSPIQIVTSSLTTRLLFSRPWCSGSVWAAWMLGSRDLLQYLSTVVGILPRPSCSVCQSRDPGGLPIPSLQVSHDVLHVLRKFSTRAGFGPTPAKGSVTGFAGKRGGRPPGQGPTFFSDLAPTHSFYGVILLLVLLLLVPGRFCGSLADSSRCSGPASASVPDDSMRKRQNVAISHLVLFVQ